MGFIAEGLILYILFVGIVAFGWFYNLFHIISFMTVEVSHWTALMLFEVLGTFFGYGALLGWLEIFEIIS